MEIKGPDDIRKFKEQLENAGIQSSDNLGTIDLLEAMRPTKDLWRAFPDETDPPDVDEIYFNDNIQLMLWFSKDKSTIGKFQIIKNPITESATQQAAIIIEWNRGAWIPEKVEPWKCRWAIAQIERGCNRTVLPESTKKALLLFLSEIAKKK
jgi:hypothetical protein